MVSLNFIKETISFHAKCASVSVDIRERVINCGAGGPAEEINS